MRHLIFPQKKPFSNKRQRERTAPWAAHHRATHSPPTALPAAVMRILAVLTGFIPADNLPDLLQLASVTGGYFAGSVALLTYMKYGQAPAGAAPNWHPGDADLFVSVTGVTIQNVYDNVWPTTMQNTLLQYTTFLTRSGFVYKRCSRDYDPRTTTSHILLVVTTWQHPACHSKLQVIFHAQVEPLTAVRRFDLSVCSVVLTRVRHPVDNTIGFTWSMDDTVQEDIHHRRARYMLADATNIPLANTNRILKYMLRGFTVFDMYLINVLPNDAPSDDDIDFQVEQQQWGAP